MIKTMIACLVLWIFMISAAFAQELPRKEDPYIDLTGGRCVGGCENGYGTWIYKNGDRYKGPFRNAMRHGTGVHFHNDGRQTLQVWRNGKVVYQEDHLKTRTTRDEPEWGFIPGRFLGEPDTVP